MGVGWKWPVGDGGEGQVWTWKLADEGLYRIKRKDTGRFFYGCVLKLYI